MKQQQGGVTLLEVMVAIIILGFGLLGLGVLQAKSIAMGQSSYFRSVAVDLGNDLGDRIRAVRTPIMVSSDAATKPGKPPDFSKCTQSGADVICDGQETGRTTYESLVNSEMQGWFTALRAQLPSASYALTKVASSSTDYFRYTLTITWLDSRRDNTNTSYSVVIE